MHARLDLHATCRPATGSSAWICRHLHEGQLQFSLAQRILKATSDLHLSCTPGWICRHLGVWRQGTPCNCITDLPRRGEWCPGVDKCFHRLLSSKYGPHPHLLIHASCRFQRNCTYRPIPQLSSNFCSYRYSTKLANSRTPPKCLFAGSCFGQFLSIFAAFGPFSSFWDHSTCTPLIIFYTPWTCRGSVREGLLLAWR